ncbi:MAG: hypothetical protein KAJ19_22080, partial [Gammaproteobacteria bacterium]|nr:hypothetical protein [Gammaproteobacteria bacterium]
MNSQKVTTNTQGQVKSADGAVLVRGEYYNELRNDVENNENAGATNTTDIAANAAAIVGQYSGALTDGAPTDAELDAAIGS